MGYHTGMIYHRGTLVEFNTWHTASKMTAGIPAEGKIGIYRGKPAPNKQRTTAYSEAVLHPSNINDYIWLHGRQADPEKPSLSLADIITLGWYPEE